MLNFTPVTQLSTPPTKADPQNFAQRADTFLSGLPIFANELNAVIGTLNTITSGLDQQEPIAAWAAAPTSYSFPDVVAGSDGQTYRCIETGVVGVNPVEDDGTFWLRISFSPHSPKLTGIPEAPTAAKGTSTTQIATTEFVLENAVPVGTTILWDGSESPPDGFLEKDGSEISRTTYANLFAVLGTRYGAGNGATTFNLPDDRGEFPRGWDHGRGVDTGRIFGSWQNEEFKSHRHIQGHNWAAGGPYGSLRPDLDYRNMDAPRYTDFTGGDETRPRNRAYMFCIKY